jgi:hypothetical protein
VTASTRLATAVVFVWLGMVLAISFLETPLKFRAPGVTVQIGLGIGRPVFRALNVAELVLGSVLVVALLIAAPPARGGRRRPGRRGPGRAGGTAAGADPALGPSPGRREPAGSRTHYWYVGLELLKLFALLITGIMVMSL